MKWSMTGQIQMLNQRHLQDGQIVLSRPFGTRINVFCLYFFLSLYVYDSDFSTPSVCAQGTKY